MFLANRYTDLVAELGDYARRRVEDGATSPLHSCDIRILLVTKYQSKANIFSALNYFSSGTSLMQPNWGESYVQGAINRYCELKEYHQKNTPIYRPKLELIGPLQNNKVSKALTYCSALHSVSTTKLLQNIIFHKNKSVAKNSIDRFPIFFQYNGSDEPQKNGCRSYDELRQLTDVLLGSQNLCLQGIMCMSQASSSEAANHRCFARARELALRLWRDYPPEQVGEHLLAPQFSLSMGMSQDYREALLEGANVLRIGSLLFSDES